MKTQREKKPYEAPRLVVLGTVEALTGMQAIRHLSADDGLRLPTSEKPFAS